MCMCRECSVPLHEQAVTTANRTKLTNCKAIFDYFAKSIHERLIEPEENRVYIKNIS